MFQLPKRRLIQVLMRRRLRPIFLAAVVGLIIAEIVALSPSSVEEGGNSKTAAVDPESLLNDDEGTLATGIPRDKIPDYSVDQFQYVSTQGTEKQWKLNADTAFLYNKEQLTHARKIHAFLYDPDGKITLVTGKEAKYFMNHRDLEIFGDVHTVFPDGFELKSEYLRYRPNVRKIEIPNHYFVHGDGHEQDGQNIKFDSQGMDFEMAKSEITLPQAVHMTMEKNTGSADPKATPDRTIIDSDKAVIFRTKQVTYFSMYPDRPVERRFVRITQPTLATKARRAELRYGDFSKLLQYMVVFEDVLIKELGADSSLRYATGGRAEFDTKNDVIRLTEFPQAYQDDDTVTGDIILLHRDTDLVEVEHSNAFSQGTNQ